MRGIAADNSASWRAIRLLTRLGVHHPDARFRGNRKQLAAPAYLLSNTRQRLYKYSKRLAIIRNYAALEPLPRSRQPTRYRKGVTAEGPSVTGHYITTDLKCSSMRQTYRSTSSR